MAAEEWLSSATVETVIGELVQDVVHRYRIDDTQAYEIIAETFATQRGLADAVASADTAAQLKRTRAYKDAATEAKRRVYYQLRTYRADDQALQTLIDALARLSEHAAASDRSAAVEAIVRSHASTRERLPSRETFYAELFAHVSPPRSILDVGCGVHPLMFPFAAPWAATLQIYVAADNNGRDLACVEAFARVPPSTGRFVPLRWELAQGWDVVRQHAGVEQFDLALLMKVVPVVDRQDREWLDILCQTPAVTWLVTGSRVALTKRVSIERRERRVLEQFVARAGRVVSHEFIAGEELCWIVKKPAASGENAD